MAQKKRWWLAPCGIDCSKCSIHLRTEDELAYWKTQNVELNKIRCDGCRSERNETHWSSDCKILQCCVYENQYEFCAECDLIPCVIIKDWEAGLEHHRKAIEKVKEMKETGVKKWLSKNGYRS